MRYLIETVAPPSEAKAATVVQSVRRLREGSRPMNHAKWVATVGLIITMLEEAIEDDPGDDE
jgi:hypothetical protein